MRRLLLLAHLFFPSLIILTASSDAGDPQIEFTSPVPLLGQDGSLSARGWARRAIIQYNRDAIPPDRRGRIKEWEHYTVMSPDFTFGITMAQLGSLAFGSVEIIDYRSKSQRSNMFFQPPISDGSVFPANPYGATELHRASDMVSFDFKNKRRRLSFQLAKRGDAPAFSGQIELQDDPKDDSIAITRPFSEPGQFFYENKIVGMPAAGDVKVDDKIYSFPQGRAFAIFDWGRGVWPRQSQWFWGQASGVMGGKRIAINLGHGYGDDRNGTANAFFLDGKLHKLRDVACQFDPSDRMKPWTFTSDDGRLVLDFKPFYHQEVRQNIGIASAELHKIHGYYSGKLTADDKTIEITDLLGFAEHMQQRW